MPRLKNCLRTCVSVLLLGANAALAGGGTDPIAIDLGSALLAIDVWADGAGLVRIVGTDLNGSDTPMIWTLHPDGPMTSTPLPSLVGVYGGPNNFAAGISPNGQWVCGASTGISDDFQPEGTIWNIDDIEHPIAAGTGSTAIFSELYGVANDGTANGFDGLLPLVKRPGQPPFTLPVEPPENFGWGTRIAANGTTMVGFYNTASYRRARVWYDDGASHLDLEDPGGTYSEAGNISPDGSRISGTYLPTAAKAIVACGWNADGIVHIPNPTDGGITYGVCYDVSNDGTWVGVMYDLVTGFVGGFIWNESWPRAKLFDDWVLETTGIALDPPVLEVYTVFHDGSSYHFIVSTDTDFQSVGVDYVRTPDADVVSCPADLAEPFGTLDFSDVVAFLTAFGNMDPSADLAPPIGTFDFSDVVGFLASFGAGCP